LTDTGTEQHGLPSQDAEFRFVLIPIVGSHGSIVIPA
jgi:hypothetical protein